VSPLRFLYTLALHLAIPFILLRLWRRGAREPGYRRHIGERFGGADEGVLSNSVRTSAIWLHAVSVGEVRAAVPLIAALRASYPKAQLLLTCMTPTGRGTAADVLPPDVLICYLPYDLPWALGRFIRRWQPMMLVVMETELWPNLLAACEKYAVPAFLANARLSEKSLRGYTKMAPVRALAAQTLARFRRVMPQSEADAARFRALGATSIAVTGNVKFDISLDDNLIALGNRWRQAAGQRAVLLFASTREREEAMLIEAFNNVFGDAISPPLLVIVPRHPSRFAEVERIISANGLSVVRRSHSLPSGDTRCWLGDSMGEMQAYFSMCDLAIIGGSFQPLGGHNLIEAAALGKAVIIGPSVFNFAEAVTLASEVEALRQVDNAIEALRAAAEWLNAPQQLQRASTNARQFAAAHRGATANTLSQIQAALKG
jgi:3-deoxy-D-manno-octulosonic-acid transferase